MPPSFLLALSGIIDMRKIIEVLSCEESFQNGHGSVLLFQVNVLIVELKSEALKERHWKQLMRRLRVNWILADLSLGQIWDADLQRNESTVRDVINVAQGEMALEEFLKQVGVLLRKCIEHSCLCEFTLLCRTS